MGRSSLHVLSLKQLNTLNLIRYLGRILSNLLNKFNIGTYRCYITLELHEAQIEICRFFS
jgi:hypothetical protein